MQFCKDVQRDPPWLVMLQGVILYGEPGTGKTLLAKAVANSTSATFLRVVGSELIQKYLGDGPKLVRELFRVADELSPSIVFIGGWPMHVLNIWLCKKTSERRSCWKHCLFLALMETLLQTVLIQPCIQRCVFIVAATYLKLAVSMLTSIVDM
jgi:hypothetical protein